MHVTDDLIFALVREPVFGEEDLSDLSSFTSSVHVLARRFGAAGSKSHVANVSRPCARRRAKSFSQARSQKLTFVDARRCAGACC